MADSEIHRKDSVQRFLEKLAQRLKQYRERHGYTLEELAEKVGYSNRSSVKRLETGESKPSIEVLARLSKVYGCSLQDLIGDLEENTTGGEILFARRTPASRLVSGSVGGDIARGIQILTALISGRSLEEIYTLEGLSAFSGNRDAIFGFLRTALMSGEIAFTYIPQATDLEIRLGEKFPQVRGAVHVVDLPETMVSEALPPELVAWMAASGVLSTLDKPPRVGIGNGYTLHRMCMVTPPSVQQFSGTQWIPLITYRDEEEASLISANYSAILLKHRHYNSTAMYLPYISPSHIVSDARYEEIHRAWERLSIAFVSGYGWSNEENARVPSSYRLIYRRLEHEGRIHHLAGEFLGYVLDHEGNILGEQDTLTTMDATTTRIPLSEIQRCIQSTGKVFFVGTNRKKASIVRVALKCGYINGLVIDKSLAKELLK
jgi:transcriptional regulator with XRE-family HTH domain